MLTVEQIPYIIAGLLISGPGIAAWVKLILALGQLRADSAEAKTAAALAIARATLVDDRFGDYRVEVAEKYATSHELAESEGRTRAAYDSLRGEIRILNDRILSVLQENQKP